MPGKGAASTTKGSTKDSSSSSSKDGGSSNGGKTGSGDAKGNSSEKSSSDKSSSDKSGSAKDGGTGKTRGEKQKQLDKAKAVLDRSDGTADAGPDGNGGKDADSAQQQKGAVSAQQQGLISKLWGSVVGGSFDSSIFAKLPWLSRWDLVEP